MPETRDARKRAPFDSPLLSALNPAQREAVETLEGPLLVLAGAGTGKTRVITTRIAHLMARGVSPSSILAVTFTNKAAGDMKERVKSLAGERARELTIGTFHSFCARILRAQGEALGITRSFTIGDSSDQLGAVKSVMRELRVHEATMHPAAVLARIGFEKNRMETPSSLLANAAGPRDELVAAVWERYQQSLSRSRTLDFDDLLLESLRLLKEHPKVRGSCRKRYRYLLVDEYQDTNRPQYEIVREIAAEHGNVCVVGDDDQSIYGFRGADVRKILGFQRDFKGAKVVRLETNYRSTRPILDAAVDYKSEVRRLYPDPMTREARWAGVEEMLNFAENYTRRASGPTLAGFLEELPLTGGDEPFAPHSPGEAVTLMTLHAAKGLEFPHVFLVGMEEGLLPHARAVAEGNGGCEEERRLAYVGITRAMRTLTLSFVSERAKYGKRVPAMPSRFVFEMRGKTPPEDWVPVEVTLDAGNDDPPPKEPGRGSSAAPGGGRKAGRGARLCVLPRGPQTIPYLVP